MTRASNIRPARLAIWRFVAKSGQIKSLADILHDPQVRAACGQHHANAVSDVRWLVDNGYLRTDGSKGTKGLFWFAAGCKTLEDVEPQAVKPVTGNYGSEFAARQTLDEAPAWVPPKTFVRPGADDFLKLPSLEFGVRSFRKDQDKT